MSEFTIGFELNNMVAAPAGEAVVQVIFRSEDGILDCYGTTVPTDADEDYATGCTFRKVNGGNATSIYVNEGDQDSALFKAMTVEA
jgi:acyl CoA:acetate/3-ketoacid CoA transferase beta subunit